MIYADRLYAALVPDLDVFAQNCQLQHALDLRAFLDSRSKGGAPVQAPRLSYGICTYETQGHIYSRHDPNRTVPLHNPELCYAFHLFLGRAEGADEVARMVTTFMWETYGHLTSRTSGRRCCPSRSTGGDTPMFTNCLAA